MIRIPTEEEVAKLGREERIDLYIKIRDQLNVNRVQLDAALKELPGLLLSDVANPDEAVAAKTTARDTF